MNVLPFRAPLSRYLEIPSSKWDKVNLSYKLQRTSQINKVLHKPGELGKVGVPDAAKTAHVSTSKSHLVAETAQGLRAKQAWTPVLSDSAAVRPQASTPGLICSAGQWA